MNIVRKIFIFFAVFISTGYEAQVLCPDSLSPTFQLTTTILSPPVNGSCQVKIEILNASGYMGGVVFPCIKYPGSLNCLQQYSIMAVIPGIYTVTVVDASSFCATSQTIQANSLPAPVVSITANTTLICSGTTATLTASGANTYSWNTSATQSSIPVTPLTPKTYSVIGTGTNGCSNTASIAINVNPAPSITVTADPSFICLNESVILSVNGAISYTWNTLQTGSSLTLSPSSTTMFTVYGIDQNGCVSNTSQVSVNVLLCTRVDQAELKNEFRIFPNPVDDYLKFYAAEELLTNCKTISIYNQLGQKIREEELTTFINTENLTDGVYFLELKGPGVLIKKRFVVGH